MERAINGGDEGKGKDIDVKVAFWWGEDRGVGGRREGYRGSRRPPPDRAGEADGEGLLCG
jgi:hypothetical protein